MCYPDGCLAVFQAFAPEVIVAITAYILEGEEGFLRRENIFPMCDEGAHTVVYDPYKVEPVCSKCGLVLEDSKFDFVIEFPTIPTKARAGLGQLALSHGLSRRRSVERILRNVFSEKSVPKAVQEKALELCRVVYRRQLQRGYSVSTLTGALVYIACRMCRVPITLAECATASVTGRKRAARCYDKLCRELEMDVPRFAVADYLAHLTRTMKVNDATRTLASEILERIRDKRLIRSVNPVAVAASCIYLADKLRCARGKGFTQKELACKAGVSEVTIRSSCKKIQSLLGTFTARPKKR